LIKKIECDNCFGIAADIAFQLTFSVFPFFFLLITILGYIGLEQKDIDFILKFIYNTFPSSIQTFLIRNINQLIERKSISLVSIAFIGTLWISSNVISSLMFHIDRIQSPQKNRSFWSRRPLSLVILFGFFITIAVSAFTILFGIEIIEFIGDKLIIAPDTILILSIINTVYPFITIPLIVFFFYYFAPGDRLSLREVFPGTFFFFVTWYLLTSLFGYYIEQIGQFNIAISILGAVMITLIWFYLTSFLILVGAEINVVLHQIDAYQKEKPKK